MSLLDSINTFLKSYDDLEIILVLPNEHIAKGQEIIDGFFDNSRIKVINGGETRFHSVQNGLSLIDEESIIFVHDGVRCLVTADLIHRCQGHSNGVAHLQNHRFSSHIGGDVGIAVAIPTYPSSKRERTRSWGKNKSDSG